MGGSTIAVASVSLAVVQTISTQRKMKNAVPCKACSGTGHRSCEICLGKGIIRARAPRTMRQMMQEVRGGGASVALQPIDLICPACGCTLEQKCLNCVGKGKIF
ncbi:hypothetical protein Ndes2437B_g05301 [Nannochloris sp. 'desiccata']